MITLRSSETGKTMDLTELDHPELKKLYTEATEHDRKKIVYQRHSEIIIAKVEDVFEALTKLDRLAAGTK